MAQPSARRPERCLNNVELLGRLGRDAETRYTHSGTAVSSFSLCTTMAWRDKQSGEWKTDQQWHNVVLWDKESLAKCLLKGTRAIVKGRLQTRNYEDKNGDKRYVTEVVSEDVILVGRPKGDGSPEPTENQSGFDDSSDDVPF